MKRLFDLLLIAAIAGALFLLLRGMTEGPERPERAAPPLVIPSPRGGGPGDAGPLPGPTVEIPPAATPGAVTSEPEPVARPLSAADWQGYSYLGGDVPAGGSLPIRIEGAAAVVADPAGRFRFRSAGGRIALIPPGGTAPELDLPAGSAGGTIAVHRYPPAPGPSPLIEPTAALLLQGEGSPPRLLVTGKSTLPEDAEIAIRLIAAGHGLESVVLRIRGGCFAGELPLSPREYHAGVYLLQFAWGRRLATQKSLSDYQAAGGELIEGEYRRETGVFFGTPERARSESDAARSFYRGALDDLEGMRDILQVAGAQIRNKRSKIGDDPARAARMRAHSLAASASRLFDGRKLDLTAWRRLLDEEIPVRIAAYTSAERLPFPTKHPQAAHNLVQLAQHVRKYSKLESTVAYEALGRPRDANDFVPSTDFDPATEREITLDRIDNFASAIREHMGL